MTKELTELVLEQPKTGFFNRVGDAFSGGWNLVRNGFFTLTGLALVGGAVASCQLDKIIPDSVNTPTAAVSVNPSSGLASLPRQITVNGQGDLIKYEAYADLNHNNKEDLGEQLAAQATPIDMSYTFTNAGTFNVHGIVTDRTGRTAEDISGVSVSQPTGPDYLDVSGILLQESNNDSNQSGIVKFYDTKNSDGTFSNPIRNRDTGLYESQINAGVPLSVTLNKLVDSSDTVYLRAETGNSANPTSYTRTIELPAVDENVSVDPRANPAVRAVPYKTGWNSTDKNNFKIQMERLNFWSDFERFQAGIGGGVNGNPLAGLKKWNWGEISDTPQHPKFRGIEISSNFSTQDYDAIKSAIETSNYQKANQLNIIRGTNHQNELGWGSIIPSTSNRTSIYDVDQDGYINSFVVELNVTDPKVVRHETLGHGLLFSGHVSGPTTPNLFGNGSSMMEYSYDLLPPDFTDLDAKSENIVEESTYTGMTSAGDILGDNF